MGLANGVIINTTSLSSTSSSSATSSVVSAVSSAIAGGESRESTESLWINSLTNFTSNNGTESNLSLSASVSSTIGSMVRSTLSDHHNTSAATLLSTLSTLTFSPFSTISTSTAAPNLPSSISVSSSPTTFTSTSSTSTPPEAFTANITSTTEASSSTVSVNHTYLDRSNSTIVNFYRTLTNPINLFSDLTTSSISTPKTTPFYESSLGSSNDTIDENNTSDSIASVIPIASPLSFFSSLSIPSAISSSSLSSSSSHSISSSELINLNESLPPLSLSSSSLFSPSSISHNNSHHINSLGNWIESTFLPPSTTLYSSSSSSFNNGNSNNSFNPSNTNFDNLISFWESIPYPKSGYTQLAIILLAFFITIIMIVIVVGNLLVCIAITTEKSLKTVQNWFIASLAVSDLLLGLVIMPFSLAYELMGYWIFGAIWCDIHHALDVLLCTASINNLCLISLDRYWSVTQAVKYLKKRTPSRAIFMICFVWIFSALVSLPPLVGWKNESIEPGECELSKDTGYVVYSSFGSFYVPAIVMVFVYAKIFVAARSRARKHVKKRKLMVSSEVTNDLTKDKSTTTTTCTSMSNPSPPDGRDEMTDNCPDPISDKIKQNCDTINCNKPTSTTGNCINIIHRDDKHKSNYDEMDSLTPCSTPTTLNTPKVTFSPRDTVYGEDNGSDNCGGGNSTVNHRDCLSSLTSNCQPPQIIIETANSSSSSSSTNNNNNQTNANNHANCNHNNNASTNVSSLVNVKNNVNSATNSGSNSVMINNRETNLSSGSVTSCDNQVSSKSTVTSPTNQTNFTHLGNSSSLSERKCPKLRIAIDDSIHNYSRNNSNHSDSVNNNSEIDCYHSINNSGNSCDYVDMSTHQIAPTSILRSNGLSSINNCGNPTNSQSEIINETRLIAADDDSDAMESPISKHSGNFALESKAFLSPSSASVSGGLCGRFGPVPSSGGSLSGSVNGIGGLTRSPYGSTMSIADYDDSDLCNDSGDQPEQSSSSLKGSGSKKSTKGKGKVQYTTPPVTRRHHTPSDAERHKRKIAKARERRATLILGLIMGSFILAWLPFFVMYLTSGLCKSCQITSGLTFGYWLGYCNSAINPIIYTVFNRDFRKAFRKILFR